MAVPHLWIRELARRNVRNVFFPLPVKFTILDLRPLRLGPMILFIFDMLQPIVWKIPLFTVVENVVCSTILGQLFEKSELSSVPAFIGQQLLKETRLNNIIAVGHFCSYYIILCTSSCAQYHRYCSITQKPKYDTRGCLGISLPYVCRYLRCIMRVMSHTLLWSLYYFIIFVFV